MLLDAGTRCRWRADRGGVAVVGPCAADPPPFMGCYAFPNHVLPRHPGLGLGIEVPTAVEALRAELPGVELVHEPGCAVQGADRSGFAAAVAAARDGRRCAWRSSATSPGLFGRGTSGEGCDAEDLRLPGRPGRAASTSCSATGTPVVVVVVSGRPVRARATSAGPAGLVQAFMPGEEGGAAIAGVLSGRVKPGGKLPVQIPRSAGRRSRAPTCSRRSAARERGHQHARRRPRCSRSGTARSYTTFEVDDLRLGAAEMPTDGEFSAPCGCATPASGRATEVVQLYLRDVVAPVARPVRQLAGFARVAAGARASRADVRFRVHADRTAFTGRELRRVVEPGEVEVVVGTSAADLRCRAPSGSPGRRVVGHDRVLTTPARRSPA